MFKYSSLSLFRVQLYHLPGLKSTEWISTDCTDILKIMRGWNSVTQIMDFRRVINNKKSVVTGRTAAAAPLSEHSVHYICPVHLSSAPVVHLYCRGVAGLEVMSLLVC